MGHLEEESVLAFLENRLPSDGRSRVEAHLAGCPSCRELMLMAADGSSALGLGATMVHQRTQGDFVPSRKILAPRSFDKSEAEARIGQTFEGKWTVERVLGIGGMAYVFAARHRNGQAVAIKLLRPELTRSGDLVSRFLREGHVASRIDHPGAVTISDDGRDADGTPFLVMELLEGETLAARRARVRRFAWPEVQGILEGVLDVLSAAHAKAIVHRDIKPQNLFIDNGGAVRVLDFGVARVREGLGVSQATMVGAVLGTRGFMAPEQARGESHRIGPPADVWALAVTAVVLLSGTIPKGKHDLERLCGGVPASAVAILSRALSADPAERYADGRAMREAMRPLRLREERASRAGSTTRWFKIGAAVATGLALAGWLLYGLERSSSSKVAREVPAVAVEEAPKANESVPDVPVTSAAPPPEPRPAPARPAPRSHRPSSLTPARSPAPAPSSVPPAAIPEDDPLKPRL